MRGKPGGDSHQDSKSWGYQKVGNRGVHCYTMCMYSVSEPVSGCIHPWIADTWYATVPGLFRILVS